MCNDKEKICFGEIVNAIVPVFYRLSRIFRGHASRDKQYHHNVVNQRHAVGEATDF